MKQQQKIENGVLKLCKQNHSGKEEDDVCTAGGAGEWTFENPDTLNCFPDTFSYSSNDIPSDNFGNIAIMLTQ